MAIDNIYCGSKFFRFTDDADLEIMRVYRMGDGGMSVKCIDSKGIQHKIDYKYLMENYKMLSPDGIMMISIVNTNVEKDQDVVVALKALPSTDNIPYAICRQSIFDFFSNNIAKNDSVVYVGVSASQDTCPANINFDELFACSSLAYSVTIAVYLDDTIDDILAQFRHKRFNDVLVKLEYSLKNTFAEQNKTVLGANKTIEELLKNNNFMYDFRKCFKIVELPFTINEDDESLSIDNILFLENEIKSNIMETYVIRYSKEIDLRGIDRDIIFATSVKDDHNKVYIVGYDTSDNEYTPRSMV